MPSTISFFVEEVKKVVAFAKKAGGNGKPEVMDMANGMWEDMMAKAGNPGQLAILESITVEDIGKAILALIAGTGGPEEIGDKVNHPEAVEEILQELYEDIETAADDLREEGFANAAAAVGGEGESDFGDIKISIS